MKMKVLMIAHDSFSYWQKEGSNKTLKKFIIDDWFSLNSQHLKKFHQEIEVECWCPERTYKKKRSFVYGDIKYTQFPTTISIRYPLDFSMEMIRELRKEVEKSKKEKYKLIIHLHEIHNLHGLLIAKMFKNEKIIVQHHGGSWPLKHVKENKKYKLSYPFFLLGQAIENRVLRNIDCFLALSPEEINYLKKRTKASVKFQTMGIDEWYFESMGKKEARKKIKFPLNKKLIVYIGRVVHVKGIKYLVDAMKDLKGVELKVIGYGPQLEEFKQYARNQKLNNVEFLGPIFGKNKLPYLSAADAFVLASSKEGAPVTVMEALARNTPVVVTDVAGVPLMIKDNREGIIIRQRNSKDIVKGVREVLKWKKDVKKYAKIYKWKNIIEETVKEYKREK